MKKLILVLKGILMGFVSVAIPGLSASTIGLELDVYNEMIESIAGFFKKFKKSIAFLAFLWIGFLLGSLSGAVIIDKLYESYPLVIVLMILGFVFGGMPHMVTDMKKDAKKVSCWITLVVVLILLAVYNFFVTQGEEADFSSMKVMDYIMIGIIGIITASTLVIPGVDFAVVLLSLGYYYPLIGAISNLTQPSLFWYYGSILLIYLAGYLVGSFLFSKGIRLLLRKFPAQTKYASFAFVIAAPIIVVDKCILTNSFFLDEGGNFSWAILGDHYRQLIFGLFLFLIAFILIFLIPIITRKPEVKAIYTSDLLERSELQFKNADQTVVNKPDDTGEDTDESK